MSLESTSGRGAGISVHLTKAPTSIDVKLGEGGLIELFAGGENDSRVCAELRDLVDLVLAGRYSEWLWYTGDRLVRCRGLLHHGDGDEVIRYRDLVPSLTRRTRREYRRYEPYR